MSGGLDVLKPEDGDITKMLAAMTHVGSENSETTMEQYIFKRRADGVNIINLGKTWEKLVLAARAIAAIENPQDVFLVSSRPLGQRAVLKCAHYIGARHIAGRFTPGAFTNQIQAAFREPRLLVVADPRADHQPVTEGSYANVPIVSFCNVDSPTRFVDLAVPCNNKGAHSIGLLWWFLAREVLRLRGSISRTEPWEVMPDLFFYRDPEEAEKEEAARQESIAVAAAAAAAQAAMAGQPAKEAAGAAATEDWGESTTDWANEPAPGGGPPPPPAAAGAAAGQDGGAPKFQVSDDWSAQAPAGAAAPAASSDWAAESAAAPAAQSAQWGGSTNWN